MISWLPLEVEIEEKRQKQIEAQIAIDWAVAEMKSMALKKREAIEAIERAHENLPPEEFRKVATLWNDALGHWSQAGQAIDKLYALKASAGLEYSQACKRKLSLAPCKTLNALAEFLLSRKSYNSIVVPCIADMREEYFEALSQNRIWKARWVRIRGTYSFFAAIGLDRAFAFVSFFVKAWKSVN